MQSLDGVADDEIDAITHRNAMRFFQLEAFSKLNGRENCTVGALRRQAVDVDLAPLRGKGGKPPTAGAPRTVTAGDVMKQLATALDGQTNARSL